METASSTIKAKLDQLRNSPTYSEYMHVSNVLDDEKNTITGMPTLKVAILRNITVETLIPVIKGEIALLGFHPEIYLGDFDTVAWDVMETNSKLYEFKPDIIIICQWLTALSPDIVSRFCSLTPNMRQEAVERVMNHHCEMLASVRKKTNAPVLINNFPLPDYTSLGIVDSQEMYHQVNTMTHLNQKLLQGIKAWTDVYLVDFMKLFARIGSSQGIDERYWHIGRAPLGRQALIPVGQEYARYIRALTGKTKKCLVLDCDNTLWGGIIGEVGRHGIQCGDAYPGSCYQAFQREILNLYDRGILLAICSKNNEQDVLDVLRNHPGMVLKEQHFVAWQINWDDKATNILAITRELNIGLDSIVFADDNPFEGGLIRDQLPDVEVIDLSGDPSTFRAKLLSKGFFDSLTLSQEDTQRSKMYVDNKERKQIFENSACLEEYLNKLDIVVDIGTPNDAAIGRVAQLTQKTNQFNTTTQRYTEGQIRLYVGDPTYDVFFMSLRDRVAELGIIGVAIVRYLGNIAEIDSFLLSCRALGRKVEEALLAHVLTIARDKGCISVIGSYTPTEKNSQVADFYTRCGFERAENEGNTIKWKISLEQEKFSAPTWIKINKIDK